MLYSLQITLFAIMFVSFIVSKKNQNGEVREAAIHTIELMAWSLVASIPVEMVLGGAQ